MRAPCSRLELQSFRGLRMRAYRELPGSSFRRASAASARLLACDHLEEQECAPVACLIPVLFLRQHRSHHHKPSCSQGHERYAPRRIASRHRPHAPAPPDAVWGAPDLAVPRPLRRRLSEYRVPGPEADCRWRRRAGRVIANLTRTARHARPSDVLMLPPFQPFQLCLQPRGSPTCLLFSIPLLSSASSPCRPFLTLAELARGHGHEQLLVRDTGSSHLSRARDHCLRRGPGCRSRSRGTSLLAVFGFSAQSSGFRIQGLVSATGEVECVGAFSSLDLLVPV